MLAAQVAVSNWAWRICSAVASPGVVPMVAKRWRKISVAAIARKVPVPPGSTQGVDRVAPVFSTHVLSSGVAGTMAANGSGVQLSTLRSLALAVRLVTGCELEINFKTDAAVLKLALRSWFNLTLINLMRSSHRRLHARPRQFQREQEGPCVLPGTVSRVWSIAFDIGRERQLARPAHVCRSLALGGSGKGEGRCFQPRAQRCALFLSGPFALR